MTEKKQSRKYVMVFAIVAFLGLITAAGLTFVADPYFQYHMPWFGREAYANDERYCNPGLAKNADYDAIIIGSSMSQNFNGEWFDEGYGVNSLKLTYSGCSVQDWVNAVNMAEQNQELRYVFGNIDLWMLDQEYGKVRYELPEYLYDNNYFNDVYYLFNKDILFDKTMNTLQNNYTGNLKNAYAYYNNYKTTYNHQSVLSLVDYKGECNNIEQKKVKIDDNIIKVVEQLKKTILKYPNTTFEIFISPASIIYYYNMALYGGLDRVMEVYQYSMEELIQCENCKVFFPSYNDIEMITDLDSYKDERHYDIDIQYKIFEEMRDGVNMATKDNYKDIIKWFRNEIINYDYKQLYEKYDYLQ